MDDTLKHYGILKMQWGVRRTPEELGHVRPGKKERSTRESFSKNNTSSEPPKQSIKQQPKEDVSKLSDQEIKDRIARLDLEKRYSTLMAEMRPDRMAPVKALVKQMASEVLTTQTKKWANQLISQTLGTLSDKEVKAINEQRRWVMDNAPLAKAKEAAIQKAQRELAIKRAVNTATSKPPVQSFKLKTPHKRKK